MGSDKTTVRCLAVLDDTLDCCAPDCPCATPQRTDWQPIETAPRNESVLIFIPNAEHYGPGIYRGMLVDFGTGAHWDANGLSMGRACGDRQPTHWMPLPEPPALSVKSGPGRSVENQTIIPDDWPRYVAQPRHVAEKIEATESTPAQDDNSTPQATVGRIRIIIVFADGQVLDTTISAADGLLNFRVTPDCPAVSNVTVIAPGSAVEPISSDAFLWRPRDEDDEWAR